MARLFFALWPAHEARGALAALARDVAARTGGRAIPPGKIHLTLAFLGETPADGIARALAAAQSVQGRAFAARLDRLGSFARSGVAWAGMSSVPPELAALSNALGSASRREGFTLESRPFAAHATLARRIERRLAEEAIDPVEWEARSFALVESDLRTGKYATRASWDLGAR